MSPFRKGEGAMRTSLPGRFQKALSYLQAGWSAGGTSPSASCINRCTKCMLNIDRVQKVPARTFYGLNRLAFGCTPGCADVRASQTISPSLKKWCSTSQRLGQSFGLQNASCCFAYALSELFCPCLSAMPCVFTASPIDTCFVPAELLKS